ncbi:MAG: hypothetical protein ACLT5P_08800 [Flavonifractor plautii]
MAHLIIAGGGLPADRDPPGSGGPFGGSGGADAERAAELLAEYQSWLRRFAAAFRLPGPGLRPGLHPMGRRGSFSRMASTPTPPATA